MSDEKKGKSPAWAITLVGRLCLIGWISVILYECFDSLPWIRQFFLAVGPWICLLAFLHAMVFLFLHRLGIFLVFMLLAFPPTIYFGVVLRNIAVDQKVSASPTSSPGEQPPVGKEKSP